MDVGNSFGAKQIQEDNLIGQLASQGRRIHFSGDDTWSVSLLVHTHIARQRNCDGNA
jgi:hypothetical protein